jgi:hypothetical protein
VGLNRLVCVNVSRSVLLAQNWAPAPSVEE